MFQPAPNIDDKNEMLMQNAAEIENSTSSKLPDFGDLEIITSFI